MSIIANINFFDLINKEATIKAAKYKLAEYQTKRKNSGKRGGVTANTFDVFFALLSSISPTMADVQKNQPGICLEACKDGQFFVFTYLPTLVTRINNLKDNNLKVLQVHKNTIYNHINLLLEAGILTEKRNYNKRKPGPNPTHEENPRPEDLNAKGRGKIQLFFNKEVLKITDKINAQFAILKQTLWQYSLKAFSFNKTLNKTILDKGKTCVQVVPAPAGAIPIIKINKEQERINQAKRQIFAANFSTKKEYTSHQLFKLCAAEIYQGQNFNQAIQNTSQQILLEHLEQMAQEVQQYRSEKIKSFRNRPAFLEASEKQQWRKLHAYTKHLPQANSAAIEIVSHAIQKQAKHAKKHGYLQRIGYPTDFLISPNFTKALEYSLKDWRKINTKFFAKNLKFGAYCEELQKIGKLYTSIMAQSSESLAYSYSLSLEGYKELKKRLDQNKNLTDSNKKTLEKTFTSKFAPIFLELSLQDKKRIKTANQTQTA